MPLQFTKGERARRYQPHSGMNGRAVDVNPSLNPSALHSISKVNRLMGGNYVVIYVVGS